MNICIDARGVNWYKGTGIGTYTNELLQHMISKACNSHFNIFWSGHNYDSFKKDNTDIILTSKKFNRFFTELYIPKYINNNTTSSLYHLPQNGIGLMDNILCKKVVTIHDLIPYVMPETVGKGYLNKFLVNMPKIINETDAIITVSNYSKSDILKFFPTFEKDKIFVTPLAANKKYIPLDKEKCTYFLKKNYNINKPFILYLGGFSSRKNVKNLMLAFSKIFYKLPKEYDLVLVGSKKDEGKYLLDLSKELNISSNIIFTDFVKEDVLPIFYNGCSVFVYPSLYEGFGLPPLEAMSCSTPVITSNLSSIPEVVENSAITINPNSLTQLIDSLEHVLNDENFRIDLSNKALAQSKKFSWDKTSELTLKAYSEIINFN